MEAIRNRWGSLSTPSVVGWDGEWHVGEDAVRMALNGSEDVWWDVKRRVGSPFRAVLDGRGHAAHDLLVPLLSALREDAEAHLGVFVSSCVLAVPACFSLTQREAMVRAADAAGGANRGRALFRAGGPFSGPGLRCRDRGPLRRRERRGGVAGAGERRQ